MNKYKFFIYLVLFSIFLTKGQINTYSPYSSLGMGDLHNVGNLYNISMGGLGTSFVSPLSLNYINPASYSFLEKTSFDFGMKSSFIKLSQGDSLSQRNFISRLSNVGLGFPISDKIGLTMALLPYSSVGYVAMKDTLITNFEGDSITPTYSYLGSGGINKLLFGLSWEAFSNVSIGANLTYLFGSLEREEIISTEGTGYYFRNKTDKVIRGFNIEIGLLFSKLVGDYKYNFGITISPSKNITYRQYQLQSTYDNSIYNSNDSDNYVVFENENTYQMTLPEFYSTGFSLSFNEKWFIGLDYNHTRWINYREDVLQNETVSYMANSNEFILGGYFTPNKEDIYNYFNRVQYRFGLSYRLGYLDLNNSGDLLKDVSGTLGMGFPINKVSSMVNIGLEYGLMLGELDNYIQEEYFSIYLSMTLNEKWFNKRKIQ